MKVSKEKIDLHNKFCLEGRGNVIYKYLGNPYVDDHTTRSLWECELCGLKFINIKWKEKTIVRSWDNYLEEQIQGESA